MYNKVANCFCLKVLELVNLTIDVRKYLETLLVLLDKENCSKTKRREPKFTKNKLSLNRKRKELKPKQPVKTKKQRRAFVKKESKVGKR